MFKLKTEISEKRLKKNVYIKHATSGKHMIRQF